MEKRINYESWEPGEQNWKMNRHSPMFEIGSVSQTSSIGECSNGQ